MYINNRTGGIPVHSYGIFYVFFIHMQCRILGEKVHLGKGTFRHLFLYDRLTFGDDD